MRANIKIAVLWGSTGYGHRSSAESLSESIRARFPEVEVIVRDIVEYLPPIQRVVISALWRYGSMYFPGCLELLRQFGTNTDFGATLFRRLIAGGAGSFDHFCFNQSFDLVITTHPIATVISSLLKARHGFKVFTVATDFCVHKLSSSHAVESLFVSPLVNPMSENITLLGQEKTIQGGIPISERFVRQPHTAEMKRILGFQPHLPLILVSFGGSGIGALKHLRAVNCIVNRFSDVQFAIVCGHDAKATSRYKEALEQDTATGRVQIDGFTTQFDTLVSASDIYLGKAGGVTISEILCSNLPIGILGPAEGIEKQNALVLQRMGLGKELRDTGQIIGWLKNVLPSRCGMAERGWQSHGYGRPLSSATICYYIAEALPQT